MNSQFASYTTRIAFSLNLGKTHVAALDHVRRGIYRNDTIEKTPILPHLNRFVPGIQGVISRGLVEYHEPKTKDGKFTWQAKYRQHYKLTKAGQLTCDLLVEAGIFESLDFQRKVA